MLGSYDNFSILKASHCGLAFVVEFPESVMSGGGGETILVVVVIIIVPIERDEKIRGR